MASFPADFRNCRRDFRGSIGQVLSYYSLFGLHLVFGSGPGWATGSSATNQAVAVKPQPG